MAPHCSIQKDWPLGALPTPSGLRASRSVSADAAQTSQALSGTPEREENQCFSAERSSSCFRSRSVHS